MLISSCYFLRSLCTTPTGWRPATPWRRTPPSAPPSPRRTRTRLANAFLQTYEETKWTVQWGLDTALLLCAMLPRLAMENCKRQFTKPTVQFILSLSIHSALCRINEFMKFPLKGSGFHREGEEGRGEGGVRRGAAQDGRGPRRGKLPLPLHPYQLQVRNYVCR